MRVLLPLILVGFFSVGADDPPAAKQEPRFEPRTLPGEGQKLLERFSGDWEVQKTFYPRAGAPVRAEGRCHQAMIHGGRFLQSDFVFGKGEEETRGTGTIGFEPDSGKFTSVWTDSRQTRMSIRRSREKFDGEQIVLQSLPMDPGEKEARPSRTVSRLDEGGRKLIHRQYGAGADGSERLVMEMVMTRKPQAGATGP